MTDIVQRCLDVTGRTPEELATILESKDDWGSLVHAFEYVSVLSVVRDEIRKRLSET